ncbi:hypothetical protein ASG49_03560 [Marmoricola sp. Leaf446]|uniref:MarR family winged helix-turn-helix transcriptional regulator n=1 Tax=Marmoricola sp. Leaf446 TaxID=1736379 RepID=UPI0006F4282E|nr:MarR family transcriptional regulator [Marmoricola sp. Leaf446]KQT94018.1 hypothetical protein ASG49_03560 [Marmoricola sp. Leaf446]
MADDETILALEHEMSVLIRRLRRRIAERARLVHPELAPVAYSMLMALHDGGAQRASALVELFSIDKGAVSRQVQTLLELGLIERTPDPDDRRAAILEITPLGRERLDAVAAQRRLEVIEKLHDWSDEDLRDFVDVMSRYNTALERG